MATPAAVVVYECEAYADMFSHESVTHRKVAQEIAALLGAPFHGEYGASGSGTGPFYFVPADTLDVSVAATLGVTSADHLFGGVVPADFVATKSITHPLVEPGSIAPPGWHPLFGERVRGVVLPGYTAFSLDDARVAAGRLLQAGPLRVKAPSAKGGLGQQVVRSLRELDDYLAGVDPGGLSREGLVLEKNLVRVETYSVGQVSVGGLVVSYCGTQRLTRNNHGHDVYGGSTLQLLRGGFDALLNVPLTRHAQIAVTQATHYHEAAIACFDGMFASRCNYDVAHGVDASGQWHGGVLEQSWRIGGATGAELAALAVLRDNPLRQRVVASTCEIYGRDAEAPPDALIYFHGEDSRLGPLLKYARVDDDGGS